MNISVKKLLLFSTVLDAVISVVDVTISVDIASLMLSVSPPVTVAS